MKFQLILVLALAYAASAQQYWNSQPLSGYGNMAPMAVGPVMTTTTPATRVENPCTEDVLRSPEIQAFRDPLDRRSYIVCTEVNVFVRMPCATGTVFDETIRHCVPEGWTPPVCPVGLCRNEADCIIDEVKNEYKCLCRVGFTGLFCETNIDECALEGNQVCQKSGGKCVDQLNAYYCDFGDKIGLDLTNAIEKPCTLMDLSMERQFFELPSPMMNVFLQCTGELEWVVSKCADMLFWNQELRTCTIEQPVVKTGVCKSFPCQNDGVCEDLGNFQFQCMCPEGFTGVLCEEMIDYCFERPCGTGRCVNHRGGYNCVCDNKIVDKSCNLRVENPCVQPLQYLPYALNNTRYFSCGLEGLAFVKDCAPGTFWEDSLKTCRAPEVRQVRPQMPMMSIFDTRPQMSGYGGYSAPVRPMMTMPTTTTTTTTTTESYGRYSAPAPVRPMMTMPTTTTTTTTTTESYGRYSAPAPVRPMMTMPTTTTTTTTTTESYGRLSAPAPVRPMMTMPTTTESYGGYSAPAPVTPLMPVTPMRPMFSSVMPMRPSPVQSMPSRPHY